MKIIEPQVELWQQTDSVAHVARCARVCYGKTEGKSTDEQLYDNLLKAKHNSMFRHQSVYAIVPATEGNERALEPFNNSPYIDILYPTPILANRVDDNIYLATNQNFMIDHKDFQVRDIVINHEVSSEHFANTEAGHSMMRYTFHITTQISTSRELNRVSPNAIAERSTRYVEADDAIVRPHWIDKQTADAWNNDDNSIKHDVAFNYIVACDYAFREYYGLLVNNVKRQDARGVLPLDTATEVVYTYSVNEWKHIIELRSAKNAHPNAQIIANMIKKELEELGYDF